MILHMAWLILKFIGIALLAILGILVLLICIVLFVPLRYRAAIACKGTKESLRGEVRLSWLCHLISVRITLDGGDVKVLARAAWKKLYDTGKEIVGEAAETIEADASNAQAREIKEPQPVPEAAEDADLQPEQSGETVTSFPADEPEEMKEKTKPDGACSNQKEEDGISGRHPRKGFHPILFLKKIKNAIAGIWEKIKYTFDRIYANMEVLSEKKDHIMEFLNEDAHQSAFKSVMRELKRLLRVLCPGKIRGNVRFGFDDPYLTGKTLAALGALYPFWARTLFVTPEFEEKVFEGNIFIKGKLRVISFIKSAAALLWQREVRKTVRDIRKFKL